MLHEGALMWGSIGMATTTFVGYQAGSLKSRILAERNYRDPMTGLVTRKGFEHRALRMMKSEIGLTVVMVDLNDLKKVNDQLGHDAGDLFIREQSGRFRDWARKHGGFAARFGGDEFVAVVKDCGIVGLREDLARPICWEGETRYWTASVGQGLVLVGIDKKDRQRELSKALKKADEKMYEEKGKKGRR